MVPILTQNSKKNMQFNSQTEAEWPPFYIFTSHDYWNFSIWGRKWMLTKTGQSLWDPASSMNCFRQYSSKNFSLRHQRLHHHVRISTNSSFGGISPIVSIMLQIILYYNFVATILGTGVFSTVVLHLFTSFMEHKWRLPSMLLMLQMCI